MSQVNAKTLMLGQNADQSKNFKITVPTPEDGTLTIERGNGDDVMKFLANGGVEMPSLLFNKAANGYVTLPNGFILQWGNGTAVGGGIAQALFPVPFPNACFQMTANSASSNIVMAVNTFDATGYTVYANLGSSGAGTDTSFRYIAIGY